MTKEREALKLVLDVLVEINKLSIGENAICLPAEIDTAMDAAKEVLAQPEQEPTWWLVEYHDWAREFVTKKPEESIAIKRVTALYTAPPQPKTPPECIADAEKIAFAYGWWKAMEAQRLAQPKQEPVAWANRVIGGRKWLSIHASKSASDKWLEYRIKEQAQSEEYEQVALYTTPPQRTWVGLTQEDIEWCYEKQKQTFNRYKNSVHGQQITEFDDPDYHLILAVTAKLKQKNGYAEEKNT